MKYNHLDNARCLFVVGPLAVYVCEAPSQEILDALEQASRFVHTAVGLMKQEAKAKAAAEGWSSMVGSISSSKPAADPVGVPLAWPR